MSSTADSHSTACEYPRAAKLLRTRRSYDASVYLCGYAVEIALKARICHTVNWAIGFPETAAEFRMKSNLKTHDLEALLEYTGLQYRVRSSSSTGFLGDWTVVNKWKPEQRYNPRGTKMCVVTGGYSRNFNVQFPRAIREEGLTYLVEELRVSSDGTLYHAGGVIKRVLTPGSDNRYSGSIAPRKSVASKSAAPPVAGSAADLPTTATVGTGVLVQCIKDGSKLRARVVSDGYDPNYNMRFPRDIREEGTLYVVDGVEEVGGSGSYRTGGSIEKFVQ